MEDSDKKRAEELSRLVGSREEWLMRRILDYARQRDYSKYTSTLEEDWRISIAGLTGALRESLGRNGAVPELGPDEDYALDTVATFAIREARLHRARGVTIEMFLGLMKYYRQSYLDLVKAAGLPADGERYSLLYIERFFDRLELGFLREWFSISDFDAVAQLQEANRAITNEKNKYITIFESIHNPVLFLNGDGRIENANHAAIESFFGIEKPGYDDYGGRRALQDAPTWLAGELNDLIESHALERSFEKALDCRKGRRIYQVLLKKMLDVSMKFEGTIALLHDITEVKRAEETILHMAYHDHLTGLPNRYLFNDRLGMALAQANRSGRKVAITMLDLDKFKEINDTFGHTFGDRLLQEVATLMTGLVRKSDTIARMGGDEFMMILSEVNALADLHVLGAKIISAFQQPFRLENQDLMVTTSVGMAIYPLDGTDVDTLVKKADIAMYEAKKMGRNTYRLYGEICDAGFSPGDLPPSQS